MDAPMRIIIEIRILGSAEVEIRQAGQPDRPIVTVDDAKQFALSRPEFAENFGGLGTRSLGMLWGICMQGSREGYPHDLAIAQAPEAEESVYVDELIRIMASQAARRFMRSRIRQYGPKMDQFLAAYATHLAAQ